MDHEPGVQAGESSDGGKHETYPFHVKPSTYHVIADYQRSSQDPLTVTAGEILQVSARRDLWNNNPAWVWIWCSDPRGKSGWVPLNLLDAHSGSSTGTARYTYSAAELSVAVGETLTVYKHESGWAWCTNQQGTNGWVPLEHIKQA